MHPAPDFANLDFDVSPYLVIWEVTRACDLKCLHCRAEALPLRDPRELSFEEGCRLIDQVREFGHPLFVLTGGDPLKRPDLFDLIRYADGVGLRVAVTPSGTRSMTPEAIGRMKEAGLSRLAVSLDGSCPQVHDTFRMVEGSYAWTLAAIHEARRIGLPVQINTTVSKHNLHDLRAIAELLATLDIALWSVFFLVPTGRGTRDDVINARDHESVFHLLYDLSRSMPFDIKTTAAQHYRRVVLQRRRKETVETPAYAARAGGPGRNVGFLTREEPGPTRGDGSIGRSAKGVNDGNGLIFIDHVGRICPSGFLPIVVGDIRKERLVDVYRNAPLMRDLRDPAKLEGKCGWCDFKEVCGGSRSRSYAVTGNPLASEPYCCYHPPKPKA